MDPSGGPHPRRHPLRVVGWLLTVVPVLVVAAVLGGCGLYLADNLADARLHADADSNVLAALWIITGLTWLLAAAAVPACVLTRRLPRPRARRLPDKDSLAETLPMRSASASKRTADGLADAAGPGLLRRWDPFGVVLPRWVQRVAGHGEHARHRRDGVGVRRQLCRVGDRAHPHLRG